MSDEPFELFKAQHEKASRDALLQIAYEWQVSCKRIAGALEYLQKDNCGLSAVNDLCCDVIIAQGLQDKLTPELLQPYIEKRVLEYVEGSAIAATGIRKHAELFLQNVRSQMAREAGIANGKNKKIGAKNNHERIKSDAIKLQTEGMEKRSIASILATKHKLSAAQVRRILKS